MGPKKKTSSLASITKKMANLNASVDNAVNSMLNKAGKMVGEKTTEEHLQSIKGNCLIVKSKSYSLGTMVGAIAGFTGLLAGSVATGVAALKKTDVLEDYLGRYVITDRSGKVMYKSTAENNITDREILDLFSADGQKIGYVKEHLISTGVPFLEKDVKKCSVYYGKTKICELKKCVSLGDLELTDLLGNVEIKHNGGKDIRLFYYKRLVAALHDVPLSLKNGYVDKFVMEYVNPEDEVIAVLLSIAMDLVNA